jgi:hypothetical protein
LTLTALPRTQLHFHACVIRSEGFDTESDGDYFDAVVEFDLMVGRDLHRGLTASVKQAAGSTFEQPLEVLPPSRWAGRLDYGQFRNCVEWYVRDQVRAQVDGHRMTDADMRVRNVRICAEETCTLADS